MKALKRNISKKNLFSFNYFLFIALILLIIPSVYSDDAILSAESAVIDITLSSELELIPRGSSYSISNLEVKSYLFPEDSFHQTVSNFRTNPRDYDLDDGAVVLSWNRPLIGQIPYSISARVETNGNYIHVKRVVDFPIDVTDIPYDVRKYLDPTKHIDSDDPFVNEVAMFLSQDTNDLYEVVYNVALWVNRNIDYNLSTLSEEVSRTSSWVLRNRRGVCAEMTSLFIALLRANGVPARYVSGIAYTNSPLFDFNWGAHAWAEVYFPGYGWIPFDVTYGEYGFIDPSHIELRKTADSGEPSSYFGWYGRDVDVVSQMFEISAEIVSMTKKDSPDFEVVAVPYSDVVAYGSYNAIEAVVKNNRNFYLPVDLTISTVNNVEIHSDLSQLLLLKPGESRKVMWIVSVSPNLAPGYVYTFPFKIYSHQVEYAETEFNARARSSTFYSKSDIDRLIQVKEQEFEKEYSNNVRFVCDFSKRFYYHDEKPELICEIINLGEEVLDNLELCMYEDGYETCKTISIDKIDRQKFILEPTDRSIGSRNILLSLENDLVIKEDSVVHNVMDYPYVEINDVEFPKKVSFGDEYQLIFLINGQNVPKDLKINVAVNTLSRTWRIDQLTTDREFILSLDSRDLYPRDNKITIKVVYNDDNEKTYSITEEYKIELVDIPFLHKLYLYPKMWIESLIA